MAETPTLNETFFGLDISGISRVLNRLRRKISKRLFLIEFGNNSITYAEARIINDQVYLSNCNRLPIDEKALERGTPVDHKAMSSFINQIIDEEQINAHRVGIVLPSQSSFSKIIFLPENLEHKEAIHYISNPSSIFQFPIPLSQTDFDLIPIKCISNNKSNNTEAYFLNSVPRKLVDNLVDTLSEANLELHSLEIAYSSVERLVTNKLDKLLSNQLILILELNSECTHFYIFSKFGPIHVVSLAAIRDFVPSNDSQDNQPMDDKTINDHDYLIITELDLNILVLEIKRELQKLKDNYNQLNIVEILLSGLNSSHPNIDSLFEKMLDLKTNIIRPLSNNDVGDISFTSPFPLQSLNRLIGLSLSMIESEIRSFNKNKFEDNKLEKLDLNEEFNNSKREIIDENKVKYIDQEESKNIFVEGGKNIEDLSSNEDNLWTNLNKKEFENNKSEKLDLNEEFNNSKKEIIDENKVKYIDQEESKNIFVEGGKNIEDLDILNFQEEKNKNSVIKEDNILENQIKNTKDIDSNMKSDEIKEKNVNDQNKLISDFEMPDI